MLVSTPSPGTVAAVPDAASWPLLPPAARDVLLEVLIHGSLPRAELARRLGLSRPTLSRLTRTLVDHGLLVEGSTELRSSTGRPSELLHVQASARHFLGVKLTGETLYAVVTDLTATIVDSSEEPLRSTAVDDVVAQIAAVAERSRSRFPSIAALGVALGGDISRAVDPPVVAHAAYLGWTDIPLATLLAPGVGLPTTVENDVQSLTVAEHWFGAGAGLHSLALITIGVGLGCGLVVHDRLVVGTNGLQGRISHLIVDPAGPVCDRGHRGCAASFLLTESIVRSLRWGADDEPTFDRALERARSGEPAALRAFGDAGFALGQIIGTVANLLDPQKIILTGDGLPLYELVDGRVWDGVRASYEQDAATLPLDVQAFDFSEWARAGAALAIRDLVSGAIRSAR
jgi:predicted NBD/HSP70 family sugar kinase